MRVRHQLAIDEHDYETLLDVSEHRCWICGNEETIDGRRLAIDHDHRTGAVRGLLCTKCNRRLGGTVDPTWLRRAADYLERAARAFGDCCEHCHKPAPSRLIKADVRAGKGAGSVFEHSCCGNVWRVSYSTLGIPFSWEISGIPVPQLAPLRRGDDVGYPSDRTPT